MLDQLFIECQPAHIQLRAGAEISPDERDLLRATRVREAFQNLPKLGFDRFELSAL